MTDIIAIQLNLKDIFCIKKYQITAMITKESNIVRQK